jgi:carboxylate-amine ligase
LARREPTFALHVHIGVGDPERAIALYNRPLGHLALLLALAANSPFWQGRDTGLASASSSRRSRGSAFPARNVRPQPRFGTVEVRVMDAQTRDQTRMVPSPR